MFQVMGVFAEFKRAMLIDRVKAGLARARASGERLGRPRLPDETINRIRVELEAGRYGEIAQGRRRDGSAGSRSLSDHRSSAADQQLAGRADV
jgi:DNA invertase Pin-like site-specific DNA recombinase